MKSDPYMTVNLSYAEVKHLHAEIGALPKSRVGPKLIELYRRLDNMIGIEWEGDDVDKRRRRR